MWFVFGCGLCLEDVDAIHGNLHCVLNVNNNNLLDEFKAYYIFMIPTGFNFTK